MPQGYVHCDGFRLMFIVEGFFPAGCRRRVHRRLCWALYDEARKVSHLAVVVEGFLAYVGPSVRRC